MAGDEKARERRNPIGATARIVGANVKRLRMEIGATQNDLAETLRLNGHPIPVASIGRIEGGQRRVEVDDVMALAVALGVSPLAILLPNTRSAQDLVETTGAAQHPADLVWRWAVAGIPWDDTPDMDETDRHLNVRRSFPWWLEPHTPDENDGSRGLWLATVSKDWRTNEDATGFLIPAPPGMRVVDPKAEVDDGVDQAEN